MQYRLVGIGGGTGAGKSTLAAKMAEALGEQSVVIGLDTFFRPNSPTHNRPEAIDLDGILGVLDRLATGQTVELPRRRGEVRRVHPHPIVILEGHLVLCFPELRRRMALSIYVDLDDDERVIRRLDRNVNRGGRPFDEVAAWYLKDAKDGHELYIAPTKRYADLIVWGDLKETSLGALLSVVRVL